MSPAPSLIALSAIYPNARIRGRFITRFEEKVLGWAVLDAATANEMGREHVGWFVGNHAESTRRAAEQFGCLDANPEGGVWVVVPHSRQLACDLFSNWPHSDHVVGRPNANNSAWRSRKVWIAVPEDLKHLLPLAKRTRPGLAGVILLDPLCSLYGSRGGTDRWGNVFHNDRPQHVVNFRAALGVDGWLPPLLLLTTKAAKAVNTEFVARTFCLNTFQFIAGEWFGCWDEPIKLEHLYPISAESVRGGK